MNVSFACGSMVLFLSFRPTGGDIPRQMRDRLIHGSSGRCAVFVHVGLFVVQTPTA